MSLTRRSFLPAGSSAGVTLALARSTPARSTALTNENKKRADELLRRMRIEEKAMQLSCVAPLALLGRDGRRITASTDRPDCL